MPLIIPDLADAMIEGLKNVDKPSLAMTKLGQAIAEYLTDNMVVICSWVATLPNPPNTPDPIVSFSSSESVVAPLPLTNPPSMEAFGPMLTTAIIASANILPDKGFTLPPNKLVFPSPIMTTQSGSDNQKAAMNSLAKDIILGVTSAQLAVPAWAGAHGPYVGAATLVKIL